MTKKEYENAVRILDAMEPVIDLIKHSHVLHYLQDLGLEVACYEAKNRIFADDPRKGLDDDQWLKEINCEMTEKEYKSACKILRALFPLIDEHAEPELSEYFGGLIDRAIAYQKKHDNFEDQLKEDGIYDEINGMSREELLEEMEK